MTPSDIDRAKTIQELVLLIDEERVESERILRLLFKFDTVIFRIQAFNGVQPHQYKRVTYEEFREQCLQAVKRAEEFINLHST